MFLFVSKSTFSKTMPLLSGREGVWHLTDEESPQELETVIKTGLDGASTAFFEKTQIELQFSEPVLQIDEGPDIDILSTCWMVTIELKIESEEPQRVIHFITPALLEEMLAEKDVEEDQGGTSFIKDKITVSEGSFASISESELGGGSGNNLDLLLEVELPIEVSRLRILFHRILIHEGDLDS